MNVFFTGFMLINWYLSEYMENEVTKAFNIQDLKFLATQFCTHLLAAGVLRQIPDKETPMYNIFKVSPSFYNILRPKIL